MSTSFSSRYLYGSRDDMFVSRASSWDSLDFDTVGTRSLKSEVENIRMSLDFLAENLGIQQYVVAREFEERVRRVYDEVVGDINEVRKKVNSLGDVFAGSRKFKTWAPMPPVRKEFLKSTCEVKRRNKLKASKSVDFVDIKEGNKFTLKPFDWLHRHRNRSLASSRSSILSSTGSTRSKVPGYGCCFRGEQTSSSYASLKRRHIRGSKVPRHSWGPSRSGSRSTLDDADCGHSNEDCTCGEVPDDWRVKVAPYMWSGWPLPGLEGEDFTKIIERLQNFDEVRQEIVRGHNDYRRRHGCPDLSESKDLSRDAQQWADITAVRGYAQYSDSQSRGENILVVDTEGDLSGSDVVDTWYRESRTYNYRLARWQRGTANFSQLIWKGSRTIGVGIAKFPFQDTYVVVVQYKPPGNSNKPGHFRFNVPAPMPVPIPNLSDTKAGNQLTEDGEKKVIHSQDIDELVSFPKPLEKTFSTGSDEVILDGLHEEKVFEREHVSEHTGTIKVISDKGNIRTESNGEEVEMSFDVNTGLGEDAIGLEDIETMIEEVWQKYTDDGAAKVELRSIIKELDASSLTDEEDKHSEKQEINNVFKEIGE